MIVVGCSLVTNIKDAISFPGMKLAEYIQFQVDIEEEDIIVYSFGCNDLNSGASYKEIFANYNKLIRGKKETYLIVPPGQSQVIYDKFIDSELLNDDFILLFTWCSNYETSDGLHPTEETIRILENELNDIYLNSFSNILDLKNNLVNNIIMEVVYADGTFDLLHPGHIDFLTRIKPDNSKLIVGVISDSNVKTYKRMPFLSSGDRAIMLSEMKIVDQVVYDCPFGGIPEDFIKEHKITKVVYAGKDGTWKDHYKVPIEMGIMSYVEYNKSSISTTKIIEKVKGEADQLSWWGEVTSNNKDEVIAKNLKLKDDRLALFKIIKDILDSNNIEYWIDQGTLLGAYRNGQIIPIDNDCDFAICKIEDYKKVKGLLDDILSSEYYYLQDTEYAKKYEVRQKNSEMIEINNSEWSLVACDICLYTLDPETNKYKQEYYQFGIDKTRIPPEYLYPLEEITFEGYICPCPCKTKEYLEEYYGYIGEDAVLDTKTSKYKKRS